MSDVTADTIVSVYFSLMIDNWDLGTFISCSGLGMDLQITQFEEGGGGLNVYQLPGRIKYTNLQVKRPIGPDTAKTMAWLNSMANGITPATAQLAALDPSLTPIFTWSLSGVVPARWTGPSFDASNPQVVSETLELAYGAIMLGQS